MAISRTSLSLTLITCMIDVALTVALVPPHPPQLLGTTCHQASPGASPITNVIYNC